MSKLLLFADLHLREDSESIVFDEVLPGILEIARDQRVETLACLGDFWHVRNQVSVRLLNRVHDWLVGVAREFTLIFLPGNHDQVDVQGQHALEVFRDIQGVRVYTDVTADKHGLWLPYRKDPEDGLRQLPLVREALDGVPSVLFAHMGLRGARMGRGRVDDDGLEFERGQFEHVLAGHYHERQLSPHGQYIGSPWQTTAAEAGQPKGVATWDGQTLQFHDRVWGPRYFDIEVQSEDADVQAELAGATARDIVRVRTPAGVDAQAVAQAMVARGLPLTAVTPEVRVSDARLAVGAQASILEYLLAYLEKMNGERRDRGEAEISPEAVRREFDSLTGGPDAG